MPVEDPRQNGSRVRAGWPWLVLVCFFLGGVAIGATASPANAPKRLVNNFQVDLTPLFAWWTNHQGSRPLGAWVRLTGSVVGTNSGAWVIEGKIEHSVKSRTDKSTDAAAEPPRVLLRNPPVEDRLQFERLSSRLAELNRQRAALIAREKQAKSREEAVNEQQRASRRNRSRARLLAAEDKQLKQTEAQVKSEQKPVDEELKELKAKLAEYPKSDQYVVDCFALDLQYDSGAVPVYDYGRVPN